MSAPPPLAPSGEAARRAAPARDSRDSVMVEARDVIRAIVGKEKRVSLRDDDFRTRNQDALDLCGLILAKFAAALDAPRPDGNALRKPRDFAARLAYNELNEERRGHGDTATVYRKLHDRFRYLLDARAENYASWDASDGRKLVGLRVWQADPSKTPATTEEINGVVRNPAALGLGPTRLGIDAVKPPVVAKVANQVFVHFAKPLVLSDLIRVAAAALGLSLEDAKRESLDEVGAAEVVGREPGADAVLGTREVLERLWVTLLEIELRYRRAYLLNCSQSGLDVQDLVEYRVASASRIGRSLELTDSEYEVLWNALPLDEARRADARRYADYDVRFQVLWSQLPVKDKIIATLMGVGETTVSNFREQAREALRGALVLFWRH